MISIINSISLHGIEGFIIKIEADVQNGIPMFNMVGLPDIAVKESKDRVKVAIKNSGFEFPLGKIIINLAPAYLRKEGPQFDLPIAIGILHNIGTIKNILPDTAFVGELSLTGNITSVVGSLNMVLEARTKGFKNIFIPYENIDEVSFIDDINIFPVKTLKEVVDLLNNNENLTPIKAHRNIPIEENFNLNFSEVKGQSFAKRALEICASGNHNLIMIGPPGGGKTMLSKRIPSILPPLTLDEIIEVNKIYSVSNEAIKKENLITLPPFREPHHTSSFTSIIGGGISPVPGEISLAHNGILYLDEFPEFKRTSLEALREPLESGNVVICRNKGTYTFPSRFMLVASMNPCKCGFYQYTTSSRQCRCNDYEIKKYINKISGPLLDRIDVHISIEPVNFDDIQSTKLEESSKAIRKRVETIRKIQQLRFQNENIKYNSDMTTSHIEKYCILSSEANKFLKKTFTNLSLSIRSLNKVIKLSRTIADMDSSTNISIDHVAEAIQYRILDRNIIWYSISINGII